MAIQPRFRVYDYFHIYWSNFKILFYACVVEGCSASLTIARENFKYMNKHPPPPPNKCSS